MLAAAMRLFRQQGYAATNVEDIARAAGVSTRTFYRYFASKDGVLAEYGHAVTRAVAEQAPPGARAPELVRLYARVIEEAIRDDDFTAFVRLLRENPGLRDHAHAWRQGWADRLAAALATRHGETGATVPWRVRTTLAVQVVSIALDEWLREGAVDPVVTHTDRMVALVRGELA